MAHFTAKYKLHIWYMDMILLKLSVDQFASCLLEATALFISWRASAIYSQRAPGSGMRSLAVMATKHAFLS